VRLHEWRDWQRRTPLRPHGDTSSFTGSSLPNEWPTVRKSVRTPQPSASV
jgi:hypothetical protein